MKQKMALKEMFLKIEGNSGFAWQKPNIPPVVLQEPSSWHCLWKSLVPRYLSLTGVLSLKELSCHADAIYSNVINLAPWKEDDFSVYVNVPPFDCPRKTSPDRVEYASIVFH